MNKKAKAVLSVALASMLCASVFSTVGCGKGEKTAVTLMTDSLSGLFNPFYATSGTDMDIVGMTQISMLTTDEDGNPACGADEATVVLDYQVNEYGSDKNKTSVYTFVLKNNLVFSDGYALTMNDVLFNMYEYLDPVYTGSSTMYSIDIEGLKAYRLQKTTSDDNEDDTTKEANQLADGRIQEIKDIYAEKSLLENPGSSSYSVTEAKMEEAIKAWTVTDNYIDAVTENDKGASDTAYYRQRILEDYTRIRKLFREELNQDFETAKEAYDLTVEPYKSWADNTHFKNDVFKFFYFEGIIKPEYAKVNGRDDKSQIVGFDQTAMNLVKDHSNQELAVNYLYNTNIRQQLFSVLDGWGTATTIRTEFAAEAKDVLLHGNLVDGLKNPTITGIKSLGHPTHDDPNIDKVTVNGKEYKVAHSHDENYANGTNKNYGKVTNSSEYDVLQITVNGTDPKAIYNFGFSVAPAHYYTADADHPNGREINIANDNFGVDWSSFAFQSRIIQSDLHVSVPVGAGPFVATDSDNHDNPSATGFWSANVVYFKKNNNFSCLGSKFEVQAEQVRFQVVSSNNAIDKLKSGEVDYVTPQLTTANSAELESLKSKGIESMAGWQLGYGYIGINAGKVPNIYVRRAIMAAMETELSLNFYKPGTCETINWPMSKETWAYPEGVSNRKSWLQWEETDKTTYAKTIDKIQELMRLADEHDSSTAHGSALKIKFTIAGASITEHPTYSVFKQAAEILNKSDCGFEVEVVADSQALTKLSTASLAVWAAAWGSTIDPDMYQVYSPYSTATSPKAWGYTQILNQQSKYSKEYDIIMGGGEVKRGLSDLIDEARSINDKTKRKALYQEAMGLVLDLAVEMPVYQRQTLYAYNAKTVTGFSASMIKEGKDKGLVNPYSSPLGKIWEIKLVK